MGLLRVVEVDDSLRGFICPEAEGCRESRYWGLDRQVCTGRQLEDRTTDLHILCEAHVL